ncbi:hypothetical protein EZS27_036987 [termite gut metagenome]|uniref:Uncharacterized protein n=1 Tax=termite gut metagenome TaxID=433724 RepID=A0A5J4PR64_9ZZZZ
MGCDSLFYWGEEMFALVGNDAANEPIISVKLEPEYGIELRDRFK